MKIEKFPLFKCRICYKNEGNYIHFKINQITNENINDNHIRWSFLNTK